MLFLTVALTLFLYRNFTNVVHYGNHHCLASKNRHYREAKLQGSVRGATKAYRRKPTIEPHE